MPLAKTKKRTTIPKALAKVVETNAGSKVGKGSVVVVVTGAGAPAGPTGPTGPVAPVAPVGPGGPGSPAGPTDPEPLGASCSKVVAT
jgi:hypothetical protein